MAPEYQQNMPFLGGVDVDDSGGDALVPLHVANNDPIYPEPCDTPPGRNIPGCYNASALPAPRYTRIRLYSCSIHYFNA